MSDKLETFERAFSGGLSGCRRRCECGVEFFDHVQSYSWEDGELEQLLADPKAVGLDYPPGEILFEGRMYVNACTCWQKRAELLMAFIDNHAHQIARYLTLERQRKQTIADNAPVVE